MTSIRTCSAAQIRKPFAPAALAAALACAFLATGAHAQNADGFTLLGNLGGTRSEAVGVSADGAVVVGNTLTTGFMGGPAAGHAFRWTNAGTIDLGNNLGGTKSWVAGISADGAVVVGTATLAGDIGAHAFRWTSAGMSDLGTLGGNASFARGVSADGAVVVGAAFPKDSYYFHAFRWTSAGMSDLGTLGGLESEAVGVSANGAVVVGWTNTPNNGVISHAFRWTSAGMRDLGTLGGEYSQAVGVSADGTVVVGNAHTANNAATHAFRWTNNVMSDLGTLGGTNSEAVGLSSDGAVVVGNASTANNAASHAFRWTSAGMRDLGTLGGTYSYAKGVSADGAVVVGSANTTGNAATRAFRWTSTTGMQSVENWLRAAGVTVASDITASANATNSNGSVVVGSLTNGTAFIARVTDPGSGLLALDAALASSLRSVGGVTQSLLSGSEIVLNGMHGMPLNYRVATGQSTVWGGGDWGRYTQDSDASGNLGVGEIGGGYNFGPIQLNAAIGYSRNAQNLSATSTQKSTGTYLFGEVLTPFTPSIWGVLSGYYQWGEVDVNRGYLNAGAAAWSTGSPDTGVWAIRARVEWEALADASRARLNPYAEVSYARAKMYGYTENNGAFPVSYDTRTDNGTDLRVGANASYPLDVGNKTRLLGVLEGVYRFQDNASDVTGKLLGTGGFNFSFAGANHEQLWARAGIGAESMIGSGKAIVMMNGATRGESPNVWLNARYQMAF